ncbi:MAG: class I SAM-dependent RNA methyltransferase, partial [Synergistetes bacterium]|nr:class I SAM-dependent RNA methyltransferase [Synergistota bacterium]
MKLRIEKMVYGGYGLARTSEGIAFVEGAISGEEVEVELVDKKESHFFARVVNVLSASPYRIPARCQFFGLCGGCDWQHISYEGQLTLKGEMLKDLFA